MEKLKIEGTDFTPRMEFAREDRVLKIEGKLFETHKTNGLDSFAILTRWMNKYFSEQSQPLTIKFRISYFDTPSSKKMFMFMQLADEMYKKGKDVKIIWEYEDGDDGKLDGETLKKKLNCPFSVDKI